MTFKKPKKGTYPAYFEKYVNKVKEKIFQALIKISISKMPILKKSVKNK